MSESENLSPGPAQLRALSERAQLARAALQAALEVPGVTGAEVGGARVHLTAAGDGESLEGVTCVASNRGGYVVALRLICQALPLHPLAEQVRTAVRASVTRAGLGDALHSVSIHVADIASEQR